MEKFYSFNDKLAVKFGVNGAILLSRFVYFIEKKYIENDKSKLIDNRYWTYETQDTLRSHYPFWSIQNIRTIIKNLKAQGAIITGEHNKNHWDRTTWYALTDDFIAEFYPYWHTVELLELTPPPVIKTNSSELLELTTRASKTNGSIPINNTINNPINNTINNPPALKEWIDYRKQIKKPLSAATIEKLRIKYEHQPALLRAAVDYTIEKGWQGLREPDNLPSNTIIDLTPEEEAIAQEVLNGL